MNEGHSIRFIHAETLFCGDGDTQSDMLISLEAGRIKTVEHAEGSSLPPGTMNVPIVAPGFIDMQINGAMDRQFTDDPTPEAVVAIVEGARKGGTAHVMPTFTTAPGMAYVEALRAVERAISVETQGILGMHLEGPFLSPEKPGIHAKDNIRPANSDDIEALAGFRGGKLLVTVAPECQLPGMLRRLTDLGAKVFAGHSEATLEDMMLAQAEGLTGATHLFNAMSQLKGREPGVVGAILSSEDLFAGIIPDGHHVAWSNVSLTARAMPDRLCLVTDAMCTLAGAQTTFEIHGKTVSLENGKITDSTGRLAGAHIAMDDCVQNMIHQVGVAPELAIQMASTNPAKALGFGNELGRVAPGYRASLTFLNGGFDALGVLVDGRQFIN